jgi:small subunit ribosomal protein S14
MTTEAQDAKHRRPMAQLAASKVGPVEARMPTRERIRIKLRCDRCGRARAVYGKFGYCRICFRNLVSDGLIRCVTKTSW